MTLKFLTELGLYRLTCDNALCPIGYDEPARQNDTEAQARRRMHHYHGCETRVKDGETFDLCYSCAARAKRVCTERRKSREIIAYAKRQWAARRAEAQFRKDGARA